MNQNSDALYPDFQRSSGGKDRRVNKMLEDADKLFSIGWLRKRLWTEFRKCIDEVPAEEYHDYARVLQGNFDSCFMLGFLSVCRKSFGEVRRIIENAYEGSNPLDELMDIREKLIREFACNRYSETWHEVKDDDQSWRKFARRLPFDKADKKEDIARFLETLDLISVITDIICEHAEEYGLTVDYNMMKEYKLKQRCKALTNEVLAKAIEATSYHLTTKSAWVVVYCVLCYDYHYELNQTQFELFVKKLPFKKNLKDCPEGTISSTMRNHAFLKYHIDKWPPENKFTLFAKELKMAIESALA